MRIPITNMATTSAQSPNELRDDAFESTIVTDEEKRILEDFFLHAGNGVFSMNGLELIKFFEKLRERRPPPSPSSTLTEGRAIKPPPTRMNGIEFMWGYYNRNIPEKDQATMERRMNNIKSAYVHFPRTADLVVNSHDECESDSEISSVCSSIPNAYSTDDEPLALWRYNQSGAFIVESPPNMYGSNKVAQSDRAVKRPSSSPISPCSEWCNSVSCATSPTRISSIATSSPKSFASHISTAMSYLSGSSSSISSGVSIVSCETPKKSMGDDSQKSPFAHLFNTKRIGTSDLKECFDWKKSVGHLPEYQQATVAEVPEVPDIEELSDPEWEDQLVREIRSPRD